MADRSLTVRLRAEVGQFRKDMEEAAKSTRGIGEAAEQAGRQQQSLRQLGEAGRAVGQTLIAVSGAAVAGMTALAVSAIRTGISYNTLEQTSRAALTTLLGSAEAANEQMERLREFGATSPFPRQVWIEAQQQLLAFGMAAERIIPTLSAIQDAVAAAGGSAVDIQEIVRVLAQVQSTGKVTAETLNQLGVRGVDAAALIGQAMGRSAGEIRDQISSGVLDAQTFLTMLTEQMSERFGGAAENVRATWEGARDRIAGATRDIGSAIAEPFIDPAGGGAAVQWGNDLADMLRALESQVRAVLPGIRADAEPALEAISGGLQAVTEAIRDMDIGGLVDDLQRGAPVLAGFAGAATAAGSSAVLTAIGMGQMAGAISPLTAGLLAMAAVSPELRGALLDLLDAVAPLVPAAFDLAVAAGQALTPTLSALVTAVEPLIDLVGLLAEGVAALPQPVLTLVAALTAVAVLGPRLAAAGQMILTPFRRLRDEMALQSALATGIVGGYQRLGDEAVKQGPRLSRFAAASAVAARGLSTLRASAAGLVAFLGGPWGVALAGAAAGLAIFTGASKDAIADVDILGEDLQRLAERGRVTGELMRIAGGDIGNFGEVIRAAAEEADRIEGSFRPPDWLLFGELKDQRQALRVIESMDEALAGLVRSGVDADVILAGLAAALGLTEEEMELLLSLLPETSREMERHGDRAEDAAEDQMVLQGGIHAVNSSLQEQHDLMRAAADPMFALHKALKDVDEAQQAYNDAVAEYGPNSEEAEDAALALFDAVLNLTGAAGDAEGMFEDGLPPAMRAAMEAAGATEEQIEAVEEAFRRARARGDEFAKNYEATVGITYIERGIQRRTGPGMPSLGELFRQHGGPVVGPPGVDAVRMRATAGEHVWSVEEVKAAGGHEAVAAMRAAVLAGQSRHAVSAPVGFASPMTRGGDGATGVRVENLNVQAWSDRFSLRQIEQELAWQGAV